MSPPSSRITRDGGVFVHDSGPHDETSPVPKRSPTSLPDGGHVVSAAPKAPVLAQEAATPPARLSRDELEALMTEVEQRRGVLRAVPEPPRDARRRDALLEDFCRELPTPLSDRNHRALREALKGFSLDELERLSKGGLRLWPRDAEPPAGFEGFQPSFTEALRGPTYPAYLSGARVLLFLSSTTPAQFRHELAHALDDLANEKRPLTRLDAFKGPSRDAEVERRITEQPLHASETPERHRVTGRLNEQLTIEQMFERYCVRVPESERAFDAPGTPKGYSKKNVTEFYAEAMAVFRGTDLESQARLLRYAPELYSMLEQQSRAAGLSVPDRSFLERIRY